MSEWLQVCLVRPVSRAEGREQRGEENRQGKNTQNTEPSQKAYSIFKDDCHLMNPYIKRKVKKVKDLFFVV